LKNKIQNKIQNKNAKKIKSNIRLIIYINKVKWVIKQKLLKKN